MLSTNCSFNKHVHYKACQMHILLVINIFDTLMLNEHGMKNSRLVNMDCSIHNERIKPKICKKSFMNIFGRSSHV
jgi:hypothetical protein